jgi:uncharacterized membrane protein YhaH (DUF805 family)
MQVLCIRIMSNVKILCLDVLMMVKIVFHNKIAHIIQKILVRMLFLLKVLVYGFRLMNSRMRNVEKRNVMILKLVIE